MHVSFVAQQRLDLLLEQEAEFNNNLSNTSFYNNSAINTIPPAYSTEENNNNSSIPKYPTQAHISSELPTYDHATIDMPPSYGSHNNKDNEASCSGHFGSLVWDSVYLARRMKQENGEEDVLGIH
nr:8707_t:CDS:2 [Entrophospora candida]